MQNALPWFLWCLGNGVFADRIAGWMTSPIQPMFTVVHHISPQACQDLNYACYSSSGRFLQLSHPLVRIPTEGFVPVQRSSSQDPVSRLKDWPSCVSRTD
ncbi:hypothetical protein K458DRAFT_49028 [Lentithecium fluviatile CBS 122367]|uniref:Secreted protein n=1 Tax=Lentithecium fluviatile CBS 122367 TaxID=1168545 RepID=A0A6G1IYD2_9PLEO|nr:hypothetical protein K458DRAFT_49028 [Lentithecium fluviatile CBS 122367]